MPAVTYSPTLVTAVLPPRPADPILVAISELLLRDRLINNGYPEQALQTELNRQIPHILWKWYRAAWELNKSEKYLGRIAAIAKEVIGGELLSDQARLAMQKDLAMFSQQEITKRAKLDFSLPGKQQGCKGFEMEK
ncbi:hypothetical protein [Egbenema bharatensis]|uniref:hypothetical protein n=1 Tax=Egbenema bharatensis TaxID=3463334 RepID=UPI003A8B6811